MRHAQRGLNPRHGHCVRGVYFTLGSHTIVSVGTLVRTYVALLTVMLAAATSAWPLDAQATRRSQRGAVMQMIGTTRIEITYTRPVARGRELFGSLVPWGRVWHPGADSASVISLSGPVLIEGHRLAAGAYSIWTIPTQDRWTVIFSRAQPVWHTPYPAGQDALRIEVRPERGSHMETLTYYFPVVEGLEGKLVLHWGEVIVPLSIRVE
ncbi:MAG TPA: DUF2911 domain-containing protein [Gemmatimonadaceae bacterium]|nr:DUF2911 domain-containing protein [Gemmatimonadaceae bacterium]